MQIYAFDSEKRQVSATSATRGCNYICFECQGVVRLRGGIRKQLHFYHLESTTHCKLSKKSLEHLHTQYFIKKRLASEEIFLEHPFPEIGRIADVVWPAKKLIFEVQCSPMTAEEIEARNADYSKVGYTVIWILHDRRYNRARLTPAELYLRNSSHYFTNINPQGIGGIYDQASRLKRGKRICISPRLTLSLKEPYAPRDPGLKHRKHWKFAFKGDATEIKHAQSWKQHRFSLKWLFIPYLILFQKLLKQITEG